MYKILRIIFCVLAAAIAAAAIFIFIYLGWVWGLISVAIACVCGGMMILFKNLQEDKERKENPPPSTGDFITGKVEKTEEKNMENSD